MNQSTAPISGSTANCLKHLSQHNPSSVVIDELTKFIGVKPPAVMEWLDASSRFPGGQRLIRLRSFLVKLGYDVSEFAKMPEENQTFCLIIGFGVLNTDDAKQILGYKDSQAVLDLALEGTSVSKDRANEFDRVLRDNQSQLAAAVDSFQRRMSRTSNDLASPAASPRRSDPPGGLDIIPGYDHRIVVALYHNLHTASWLAEAVVNMGEEAKELLGGMMSERELGLVLSRIQELLPEAAAQSVDK